MPRQGYEFIDKPSVGIDLSYVISHQNHNKSHYFMDTIQVKSIPFTTFPFHTKFIL